MAGAAEQNELRAIEEADAAEDLAEALNERAKEALAAQLAHQRQQPRRRERAAWSAEQDRLIEATRKAEGDLRVADRAAIDSKVRLGDRDQRDARRRELEPRLTAIDQRRTAAANKDTEQAATLRGRAQRGDDARQQLVDAHREVAYRDRLRQSAGPSGEVLQPDVDAVDEAIKRAERERWDEPRPAPRDAHQHER